MRTIDYCYMEFHSSDNDLVGDNEQMGLLRFKTPRVKITQNPTFILFTIDNTGSMNERGTRNSSKMDIVKHSFKNIAQYLSKQDAPIFISVHTFSDHINVVIDETKLTLENVDAVIEKIQSIEADGSTNMELALENARTVLNNYQLSNKNHKTAHIFMTDGNVTQGSSDNDTLNRLVETTNSGSVFVGFGNDHNVNLLKRLSENKCSFYQYIRDFESTACIYGEILHPYLYPCYENVSIMVKNGQIYDWKTNTWTDRIDEDIVIGEIEKIYHIKSTKNLSISADPNLHLDKTMYNDNITIDVYGNVPIYPSNGEIPYLFGLESGDIIKKDLTQYIFRYMTMCLLFRSTELINVSLESRNELRKDIRSLFTKMRDYMRIDQVTDEAFMKQLCDDLYIAYHGVKNEMGGDMLTLSRFTSQGRQQTNISTPRREDLDTARNRFIEPLSPIPKHMRRQNRNITFWDNDEEFVSEEPHEIDEYQITERTTSCYATQPVLDTMTQIFGTIG